MSPHVRPARRGTLYQGIAFSPFGGVAQRTLADLEAMCDALEYTPVTIGSRDDNANAHVIGEVASAYVRDDEVIVELFVTDRTFASLAKEYDLLGVAVGRHHDHVALMPVTPSLSPRCRIEVG